MLEYFIGTSGLDSGQKLIALVISVGLFVGIFGGAIGLLLVGLLQKNGDESSAH